MTSQTEKENVAHTPGPWRVERGLANHFKKCGGDWRVLVPMPPVPLHAPSEEIIVSALSEGNARLIAAAPELLKALRDLVTATENADNFIDMGVNSDDDVVVAAKAAIAKAEG